MSEENKINNKHIVKYVELVNHKQKKVYKMKIGGFSWKMFLIPYIVAANKQMWLKSFVYFFTWFIPFYNIYNGLFGNKKIAKNLLNNGWIAKTVSDYKILEELSLVPKNKNINEKTFENNNISSGV